jgi:hypothetical protein
MQQNSQDDARAGIELTDSLTTSLQDFDNRQVCNSGHFLIQSTNATRSFHRPKLNLTNFQDVSIYHRSSRLPSGIEDRDDQLNSFKRQKYARTWQHNQWIPWHVFRKYNIEMFWDGSNTAI